MGLIERGVQMGLKEEKLRPSYRAYTSKQVSFMVVSPEIKATHPLVARIEDFVENHIPMPLFEAKVNNRETGAPAVHPKMMLKVLLLAYTLGIRSSRKIEVLISTDSRFNYLAGGQGVDHSTICDFRITYAEEISRTLDKMVYVLHNQGYIGGKAVAVDGTKVRADAGRRFTGNAKDFRRRRKRIRLRLKKWALEGDDTQEGRASLEREAKQIDEFLDNVDVGDETQVRSLTDSDARLMRDNSGIKMGYNCQAAVDTKHHFMVAARVSNNASDSVELEPMLGKLQAVMVLKKDTKVLADAGYFSGENVRKASELRVDAYIPEGKEEEGRKRSSNNMVNARSCKYELDGKTRRLICPGAQVMETEKAQLKCRKTGKAQMYYYFRADKDRCKGCSLYERCYVHLKPGRGKVFTVKREYFDSLELREKMAAKLATPEGKRCMRCRGSTVEHVFGTIKDRLGLRRFRLRGLRKVMVEWVLGCMAYNFIAWTNLEYG
jgi:transposase